MRSSIEANDGVLVFNAGSSSIKFALFGSDLSRLLSGSASEIGGEGRLVIGGDEKNARYGSHLEALDDIFDRLSRLGIQPHRLAGAAHRVVHGGRKLIRPCRITPEVTTAIEACIPLAPLHNPHNLAVILAVGDLAPNLRQYASFDTGFHASNPEVALRYAIPRTYDRSGIRRYGFHGISYSGLVKRLPAMSGRPLPPRLLALHLGNGASLCAIRDGESVATTMGYSPLDGLTMGTRSGGIDGNAVLRLATDFGLQGAARILNHESGLLGLGGMSDMRKLHAAGTDEAAFAIEHFCYWAVRHAGSMIAAMGGIDAIAFTGGIGENDSVVRARIMTGLSWMGLKYDPALNDAGDHLLGATTSSVSAHIVPADEERTLAENVRWAED